MQCEQLNFFRDAVSIFPVSVFDLGQLVFLEIGDVFEKIHRLSLIFRHICLPVEL